MLIALGAFIHLARRGAQRGEKTTRFETREQRG